MMKDPERGCVMKYFVRKIKNNKLFARQILRRLTLDIVIFLPILQYFLFELCFLLLSYQDKLNNIGEDFVKLTVYPEH